MQSRELNQVAARLYARREAAVILKWADVAIGEWRPQENECHENAATWCENNPDYQIVRGWLYFAFEDALPFVLFNPHSVVRSRSGDTFDITPSKASQQYPFLVAEESEEAYASLVHGNQISRLVHIK